MFIVLDVLLRHSCYPTTFWAETVTHYQLEHPIIDGTLRDDNILIFPPTTLMGENGRRLQYRTIKTEELETKYISFEVLQ